MGTTVTVRVKFSWIRAWIYLTDPFMLLSNLNIYLVIKGIHYSVVVYVYSEPFTEPFA